jgi:hypothetical protein
MSHTPAPWLVEYDRDEYNSSMSTLRIIDSTSLNHPQGPLTIARVNVAAHAPHMDEPLANAALIAAAPLLMRALGELLREHDALSMQSDGKIVDRWPEKAKAARAALRAAGTMPAEVNHA